MAKASIRSQNPARGRADGTASANATELLAVPGDVTGTTGGSTVPDPSGLGTADGEGAAAKDAAATDGAGAATPDGAPAEGTAAAGVPFDERKARIAV
jgi:hypothetical protein